MNRAYGFVRLIRARLESPMIIDVDWSFPALLDGQHIHYEILNMCLLTQAVVWPKISVWTGDMCLGSTGDPNTPNEAKLEIILRRMSLIGNDDEMWHTSGVVKGGDRVRISIDDIGREHDSTNEGANIGVFVEYRQVSFSSE